jgi:hypothetical protein
MRSGSTSTIRIVSHAFTHSARLLEIDMPARGLSAGIGENKCVDTVALLDGILAIGLACVQRGIDGIKGNRRWEVV